MPETEAEKRTVGLNYVGRLYDDKHFIAETKKYGVQRAIPFFTARRLNWGDPILLARWEKGHAKIFGYFRIENLVVQDSDNSFKEFLKTLNCKVNDVGRQEIRICGFYTISSTAEVNESLPTLVEKYSKFLENKNVRPNSLKWFIRGSFKSLDEIRIPLKFSRGILRVDAGIVERKLKDDEELKRLLVLIRDYQRRAYLNNEARAEYEGNLKGYL